MDWMWPVTEIKELSLTSRFETSTTGRTDVTFDELLIFFWLVLKNLYAEINVIFQMTFLRRISTWYSNAA